MKKTYIVQMLAISAPLGSLLDDHDSRTAALLRTQGVPGGSFIDQLTFQVEAESTDEALSTAAEEATSYYASKGQIACLEQQGLNSNVQYQAAHRLAHQPSPYSAKNH